MKHERIKAEGAGTYEEWAGRAASVSLKFFTDEKLRGRLERICLRHNSITPNISNYSRLYHSMVGSGIAEHMQGQAVYPVGSKEMIDFETELKDLIVDAEMSKQGK